jgi:hypothetical protein
MPDEMIGFSETRCELTGLAARLRHALTDRELAELVGMLERRHRRSLPFPGEDRRRQA